MADRLSLRDYQRDLVARLREPRSASTASMLGLEAGGESWLVDLADAGEVLRVPPVSPLPLTRPWFRGLANVRGNLYSVIDFAAFLGGAAASTGDQSRLLLLGERFRVAAALLVDRSLGLRSPSQLRPRELPADKPAWLRAEHADEAGALWKELDVPELVRHPDFLAVGL